MTCRVYFLLALVQTAFGYWLTSHGLAVEGRTVTTGVSCGLFLSGILWLAATVVPAIREWNDA